MLLILCTTKRLLVKALKTDFYKASWLLVLGDLLVPTNDFKSLVLRGCILISPGFSS